MGSTVKILSGPSKRELITLGLGEGQAIQFTFEGLGSQMVRIFSVAVFDQHETWTIRGILLSNDQFFSGQFSTIKGLGKLDLGDVQG
jgi:hypothetical protein